MRFPDQGERGSCRRGKTCLKLIVMSSPISVLGQSDSALEENNITLEI